MNSWWLKLYTIPHLKSFTIRTGLVLLLNYLVNVFVPALDFLATFTLGYPVYLIFKNGKDDLIYNLDFHKVSIPFKDLRKALLLDSSITLLYTMGFFLIGLYLVFGGPELDSFLQSTSILGWSLLLFFGVGIFGFTLFLKVAAPIKQKEVKSGRNYWHTKKGKRSLWKILPFPFLGSFAYLLLTEGQLPEGIVLYQLSLMVIFFPALMFMSVGTQFHLVKPTDMKRMFAYFLKSSAVPVSLVAVIWGLAYLELRSDMSTAQSKAITFELFHPLAGELSADEVHDYLKVTPYSAPLIFAHASHETWQRPFPQIYEGKNLYVWASYLERARPLPQNVEWMTKQIEAFKDQETWQDVQYYRFVKMKLVQFSPEAKSLPDSVKPKIKVSLKPQLRQPASSADNLPGFNKPTRPKYRSSPSP